jgi:large subunit ribosomal protein L29
MKSSELNTKSAIELQDALKLQLEELFKFRMQRSIGQLGQSHLLKKGRRNIARIKTLINQKAGV